jgi:hypothetical protein
MKNSNTVLLVIGGLLVAYGILGPVIKNNMGPGPNSVVTTNIEAPLDPSLRKDCEKVITVFQKGSGNKSVDGVKLSNLYSDLAKLVSLDGENETIKNTDEIRDANRLAGLLYDLDLKGKYPELSVTTNDVVKNYIGDDNVVLDPVLRKKAVEAFNGLAWAYYEGSK